MNNLITPKPKELPFSIYTEEKQVAVRKATKPKTTTKRMLYKATPTHMSSNSSNSDTPDSISSLEELEDLNTCQIIEVHNTSSENELVEDLNACQIIVLDSSEKVKTKKVVSKTKKKELSENKQKTTTTTTQESRTKKQQLNVEETKLDSQTPKTRGRPRRINKLANDENLQPAAVLKPTILTRRRRLN